MAHWSEKRRSYKFPEIEVASPPLASKNSVAPLKHFSPLSWVFLLVQYKVCESADVLSTLGKDVSKEFTLSCVF